MRRLVLGLCICLGGCVAPKTTLRDDVGRLRQHPEYGAAWRAAPSFTKDAMETIARLNHELNRQ